MNKLTPEEVNLVKSKLKPIVNDLNAIISHPFVIAGGCIASILQGEEPSDYDIYSSSVRFIEAQLDASLRAKVIVKTKNASTYNVNGNLIQLIKVPGFMNLNPHYRFDLKHARNSFRPDWDTLTVEYPDLIKLKVLELSDNYKPGAEFLKRLYKFAKRGYTIPRAEENKFMATLAESIVNRYSNEDTKDLNTSILKDLTSYSVDTTESKKANSLFNEIKEWLG